MTSPGAKDIALSDGKAGATMIELLVVTAILATVALSATLSVRLAPGQTPVAKAEEFARAITYLKDEGMLAGHQFALSFSRNGWRALMLDEVTRLWAFRDEDRPYAGGNWGERMVPRLTVEGREVTLRETLPKEPAPDVFLLSSGESTPFTLRLQSSGGEEAGCAVGRFGELSCQRGG